MHVSLLAIIAHASCVSYTSCHVQTRSVHTTPPRTRTTRIPSSPYASRLADTQDRLSSLDAQLAALSMSPTSTSHVDTEASYLRTHHPRVITHDVVHETTRTPAPVPRSPKRAYVHPLAQSVPAGYKQSVTTTTSTTSTSTGTGAGTGSDSKDTSASASGAAAGRIDPVTCDPALLPWLDHPDDWIRSQHLTLRDESMRMLAPTHTRPIHIPTRMSASVGTRPHLITQVAAIADDVAHGEQQARDWGHELRRLEAEYRKDEQVRGYA